MFEECIIVTRTAGNQETTFTTTNTELMSKLWHSLLKTMKNYGINSKRDLKEQLTGININQNQHCRHETDVSIFIDSICQGVNRLFVSSFENDALQRGYKKYSLPTVKIEYYNVMIDAKNL